MLTVQSAGFSDIGKVRKANEDCLLLNEPAGLYVVADGMGGHRCGGVASRIAVDTIETFIVNGIGQSSDKDMSPAEEPQSEAAKQLRQSIFLANQKIYSQSVKDSTCRGMGTTVSALYLAGNSIITANVGDSPIYLLRNGEIEDLYTPHTLFHERKKVPKSLEGRFSSGKLAHILTRAVGIRPEVGVDLVETPCFSQDIIVLCSDGLSGKISREEIRDLACRNDSEAACSKLTGLANQRGGEDNITVIVVRVKSVNGDSAKRLFGRLGAFRAWAGSLFSAHKRF
ncbi:PP2C family protein-serine/threonine phosphatase [Desulfosarcina sp.]|uniref:PP2C family protein-serine/threonine phosphatase n=1 Tax=Desulfosarcina sp. TaxID=2027861 RepID=UPI003970B361